MPQGVIAQDSTPTINAGPTTAENTSTPPPLSPSETPLPTISDPQPGQAIQGKVNITGSTNIAGFQIAEIEFAYTNNPTNTWFLIQRLDEPVTDGLIIQWDTTTISDGTYDFRITVQLENGDQMVTTISGLRVRNYSPIETNTPTMTSTPQPGDTPDPTGTPSPTHTLISPTNTPLPINPAQLSKSDLAFSLGTGVLVAFVGFLLIGIYILLRKYVSKL